MNSFNITNVANTSIKLDGSAHIFYGDFLIKTTKNDQGNKIVVVTSLKGNLGFNQPERNTVHIESKLEKEEKFANNIKDEKQSHPQSGSSHIQEPD